MSDPLVSTTINTPAPDTLSPQMQVFMVRIEGLLNGVVQQCASSNELLSERMKNIAEKQDAAERARQADVESLKLADTHLKGNLDTKIDKLCIDLTAVADSVAVKPADKAKLEAREDKQDERLETLERRDGERGAVQKVVLGGLGLAWAAIIPIAVALLTHALGH